MNYPNPALIRRRRRRERILLIVILSLVVLFGFLEGWFFQYRAELPVFGNILLFALINLNVLLLLLLIYLVLRNVVKLVFERRQRILGHKLRTRLTLAFVGLTLIPTLPLFGLATQFISFSLEYWFSNQVEQSLEQSVLLGKDYLRQVREDLLVDAQLVQWELFPGGVKPETPGESGREVPRAFWERYHVQGVFVADAQGTLLWEAWKDPAQRLDALVLAELVREWALSDETVDYFPLVPTRGRMEAMVAFRAVEEGPLERTAGVYLGLVRTLPGAMASRLDAVVQGYENYSQLKLLKAPLKTSHLITFSIATLLVLFAVVWFGLYLARDITGPIQGLLMATERVAEGDLDVSLDWERDDEIGTLLASFNRMVRDLRQNREQLTLANEALQESNRELEERRRYMEIVLRNIGAGVVSVDVHGTIRTMNKAAEEMKSRLRQITGRPPQDFPWVRTFHSACFQILKEYCEELGYRRPLTIHSEYQQKVTLKKVWPNWTWIPSIWHRCEVPSPGPRIPRIPGAIWPRRTGSPGVWRPWSSTTRSSPSTMPWTSMTFWGLPGTCWPETRPFGKDAAIFSTTFWWMNFRIPTPSNAGSWIFWCATGTSRWWETTTRASTSSGAPTPPTSSISPRPIPTPTW